VNQAVSDHFKPLTTEDLEEMVERANKARTLLTECGLDVASLDDVERLVTEVRRLRGRGERPS
jgi:hypothetical protein